MTKDQYLQFRVPGHLKEAAQRRADEDHVSLSEVLRRFLEDYVERVEPESPQQ